MVYFILLAMECEKIVDKKRKSCYTTRSVVVNRRAYLPEVAVPGWLVNQIGLYLKARKEIFRCPNCSSPRF